MPPPRPARSRRRGAARYRLLFSAVPVAAALIALAVVAASGTAPSRLGAPLGGAARTAPGIRLEPIDGGAGYFARKSSRSAWMDKHILLGAWLEQPESAGEVADDERMGNDIYWNLAATPGPYRVNYNIIRAGGMHASAPDTDGQTGDETVSRDGHDESDMTLGPGWGRVSASTGNCASSGAPCGYTVDSALYKLVDHRYAVHQGYGKGVLFWETPRQAAEFLNFSDILSADSYWLTDNDLKVASQGGCALLPQSPTACGGGGGSGLTDAQAHLPANYAYDVTELERLQALNGSSKPVVVDVETGCPFSGGSSKGNCATPAQTVAAAWHALIAGARGIIWFQHNFSGRCVDFKTFVDGSNPSSPMYGCQQTPHVTLHGMVAAISAFNHEVTRLSGVLLSATITGFVRTADDVSTLAKARGGSCYVFAGSGRPATPPAPNQVVRFSLAARYTGPVRVVGEGRTLHATRGQFTDTFSDADAVHIYRIRPRTGRGMWPCGTR